MNIGTGSRNRTASLCKIALAILESTGDLGDLASITFRLGRGLKTLDFLQSAVVT